MNAKPIRTRISILFNHKNQISLKNQFLSISNGIRKSCIQKLQVQKNSFFSIICLIFLFGLPTFSPRIQLRIKSDRNSCFKIGLSRIQSDKNMSDRIFERQLIYRFFALFQLLCQAIFPV